MSPSGVNVPYIKQQEELGRDAAPMRTTCFLCDWFHDGTAIEGREAAAKHRAKHHPEAKQQRRTTRSLQRISRKNLRDDELAEIQAERKRRSFVTGIELED